MQRHWQVVIAGQVVADRVVRADRWWQRLIGLLATPALDCGDGLWLKPCSAVHTLGMRYALDLLFLDEAGRIVRVARHVPPGRLSVSARGARSVLELPSGTLASESDLVGLAVVMRPVESP